MSLSKEERAELGKLSLEAFGNKNHYRKYLERGEPLKEMETVLGGPTRPVTRFVVRSVEETRQIMLQAITDKVQIEENKKKADLPTKANLEPVLETNETKES